MRKTSRIVILSLISLTPIVSHSGTVVSLFGKTKKVEEAVVDAGQLARQYFLKIHSPERLESVDEFVSAAKPGHRFDFSHRGPSKDGGDEIYILKGAVYPEKGVFKYALLRENDEFVINSFEIPKMNNEDVRMVGINALQIDRDMGGFNGIKTLREKRRYHVETVGGDNVRAVLKSDIEVIPTAKSKVPGQKLEFSVGGKDSRTIKFQERSIDPKTGNNVTIVDAFELPKSLHPHAEIIAFDARGMLAAKPFITITTWGKSPADRLNIRLAFDNKNKQWKPEWDKATIERMPLAAQKEILSVTHEVIRPLKARVTGGAGFSGTR